jgi:hypothetical protein
VVVTPAEAADKLDAAARKLSRELGYREPAAV